MIPLRAWVAILLTLAVVSCAHPYLDKSLPLQDTPSFSDSGEELPYDLWWMAFADSGLDAQIDIALNDSFTLDAAWERVLESRALAWREATDLYPDLDGVADAGGIFRPGRDISNFALGLDASYEVDLWGRIQSSVEAERLRAMSTEADFQTTALFLSAEIAITWYSLVEANAQYALSLDQVESNQQGVELLESRFAGGEPNTADVLRQRQLVEATREQSVVDLARIELLEHRLAILQGRPPQAIFYESGNVLPSLPPLPQTGLPSELLLRRPDIQREFLALMAADRDVAAAISAQYPRLDLSASLTTAAESPENLFRDWIASVAGQLVAPLFDAGQRQSDVQRTAAIVRRRVAEYGDTVLLALVEVEDALTREKYARQRIVLLESQIELAEKSLELLQAQYLVEVTDYLSVLSAITALQRLQRGLLSTRLELILARIELYRALSGDVTLHYGQAEEILPPIVNDP